MQEWGGFLQQETIFEIAAERKRRALQTRERENRASELTGVYDFFCEPLLCNNPSYLAFLDRMEQQAPAFSDLFDQYPTLRELPGTV